MYEIDAKICNHHNEGWLELVLDQNAATELILNILRIKLKKANSFYIRDRNSKMTLEVSFNGTAWSASSGELMILLNENNAGLTMSFLVDCTDKYIGYDHIDFTADINGSALDITIAIKRNINYNRKEAIQ